jgi:3-phenylpropionate/cinnamic acid dioxygenase small subunit
MSAPDAALDAILRDTLTSTYVDDDYYALLRTDVAEWDVRGTPLTEDERATFEALVLHESWLLDRRRFEDWYGLYARECLYWVPAGDPVADPAAADPRSRVTIACDDRRRLGDRIVWLRTGVAYSQLPPSHTAHLSSGFVRVPTTRPDEVKIRSNTVVHEVRSGHVQQTLAGWTGHVLVEEDGGWRIARKTVALLDAERAHHNLTYLL